MKITVISTNETENFPLGKVLDVQSLSCKSQALKLYEVCINGATFTAQITQMEVVSLSEIVIQGYFSSTDNINGEKLIFLGLSIQKQ